MNVIVSEDNKEQLQKDINDGLSAIIDYYSRTNNIHGTTEDIANYIQGDLDSLSNKLSAKYNTDIVFAYPIIKYGKTQKDDIIILLPPKINDIINIQIKMEVK